MVDRLSERRRRTRFPIALVLNYAAVGRGRALEGAGKTINISSRGVLITTDRELPSGTTVSLSIDWPVRLNQHCSLALFVGGTVVRSERREAAVQFSNYELRTRPIRAVAVG